MISRGERHFELLPGGEPNYAHSDYGQISGRVLVGGLATQFQVPGSRAKAAKATEELLYKDFVPTRHRVRVPWLDKWLDIV